MVLKTWKIHSRKLISLYKELKNQKFNLVMKQDYVDVETINGYGVDVLGCINSGPHVDESDGYTALLVLKASDHWLFVKPGKRHLKRSSDLPMPKPPYEVEKVNEGDIIFFLALAHIGWRVQQNLLRRFLIFHGVPILTILKFFATTLNKSFFLK